MVVGPLIIYTVHLCVERLSFMVSAAGDRVQGAAAVQRSRAAGTDFCFQACARVQKLKDVGMYAFAIVMGHTLPVNLPSGRMSMQRLVLIATIAERSSCWYIHLPALRCLNSSLMRL